jgi:HEPN domain-containing protein
VGKPTAEFSIFELNTEIIVNSHKKRDLKSGDFAEMIRYWLQSSDYDYDTMVDLYKVNRYHWALFMGHLSLEKLLKAYYIHQKHENPPLIHNLLRLAELTDLKVNDDQKKMLAAITTFNLSTRYDDYNMSFYKKCTKEFTEAWIENIKTLRLWIKQLIS